MAIKKFKNWELPKKKKSDEPEEAKQKRVEDDSLADSISDFKDKLEKLKDGEFEIVGINDVSIEKPENANEATIINADLGNSEVKRGDVLWITAMIKKKNVTWNSMAVLKVRITDMYSGLSILNTLK
jgi:hypothetical protein